MTLPRGGRACGAALTAIGLFALIAGRNLPFGTLREPEAGFFPLTVATILMLFGALCVFDPDPRESGPPVERAGAIRVGILAVLLAVYAWLLPPAGFVPCTVVLLAAMLRGLGVRWVPAVAAAVAAAAGCYVLFTRLGMPLPGGLLNF